MDPAAVAAYYRGKGYVVRDGVRVAGASGTEHRVPLLAEGPLGSLAVFFGDFGGVDGPEMGGARKVAREVGATPVLAADTFSNQDRQVASRLGVVLLDAATLEGDAGAAATGLGADTGRAWPGLAPMPARKGRPAEDEPHPWPVSGRVGGLDGPGTRAVDVDEILAQPRAASPSEGGAAGEAGAVDGVGAGTDPLPASATLEAAAADGEGLWRKARTPAAPAPRVPRTPGSQRFAWLGGPVADAPPAKAAGTGPNGPLAIEYDDVVASKAGAGGATTGAAEDDERLGESIELQPTLAELDRKERHDRLMRRLFWILFFSVLLYLFALWWF
jgi:hypothetical protein